MNDITYLTFSPPTLHRESDEGQAAKKDDDQKNNPRKVFSTSLDQIWLELASSGVSVVRVCAYV